jgi:phage FluMu gp28-like protein
MKKIADISEGVLWTIKNALWYILINYMIKKLHIKGVIRNRFEVFIQEKQKLRQKQSRYTLHHIVDLSNKQVLTQRTRLQSKSNWSTKNKYKWQQWVRCHPSGSTSINSVWVYWRKLPRTVNLCVIKKNKYRIWMQEDWTQSGRKRKCK